MIEASAGGFWIDFGCDEQKHFVSNCAGYIAVTKPRNWYDAHEYCKHTHNSNLATITTNNAFNTARYIASMYLISQTDDIWIGFAEHLQDIDLSMLIRNSNSSNCSVVFGLNQSYNYLINYDKSNSSYNDELMYEYDYNCSKSNPFYVTSQII